MNGAPGAAPNAPDVLIALWRVLREVDAGAEHAANASDKIGYCIKYYCRHTKRGARQNPFEWSPG